MKRSVLVVEDDDLELATLSLAISGAGYRVVALPGVSEALDAIEAESFDAAIIDWSLGRDLGLAVLWELRKRQPNCVRILCTGHTETPVLVGAVNHGEISRVIAKPYRIGELLGSLAAALESAEQLQQRAANRAGSRKAEELLKLEEAILPEHLGVAVQPIVQARRRDQPVFFEALIRPRHPDFDTPVRLLEAADRHDRVLEVTMACLRTALDLVPSLPVDVGLFINLHPLQLGSPRELIDLLEPYRADASRITLEITERSRLESTPHWQESLRGLQELGFAVAVDDLGAGYNSLSILADLQPDFMKLDMSLVRSLDQRPRKRRLVQLMTQFGAATGCRVIAEGVETPQEEKALRDCGVELLQGYLLGRPAPALWASRGEGRTA